VRGMTLQYIDNVIVFSANIVGENVLQHT
jgi:hypothetical protein